MLHCHIATWPSKFSFLFVFFLSSLFSIDSLAKIAVGFVSIPLYRVFFLPSYDGVVISRANGEILLVVHRIELVSVAFFFISSPFWIDSLVEIRVTCRSHCTGFFLPSFDDVVISRAIGEILLVVHRIELVSVAHRRSHREWFVFGNRTRTKLPSFTEYSTLPIESFSIGTREIKETNRESSG